MLTVYPTYSFLAFFGLLSQLFATLGLFGLLTFNLVFTFETGYSQSAQLEEKLSLTHQLWREHIAEKQLFFFLGCF
jgi:hypothetical protein